jgi:hypothetical protein
VLHAPVARHSLIRSEQTTSPSTRSKAEAHAVRLVGAKPLRVKARSREGSGTRTKWTRAKSKECAAAEKTKDKGCGG